MKYLFDLIANDGASGKGLATALTSFIVALVSLFGYEASAVAIGAAVTCAIGLFATLWGLHRRTRASLGTHAEQQKRKTAATEPLEG